MTIRSRARRIAAALTLGIMFFTAGMAHAGREDADTILIDSDSSTVVMGGTLRTSRPIPRNFVGAGGTVAIEHPVGRSLVVAGGTVHVRAPVGKDVHAAGGTVNIDAPIGSGLAIAAGDARLGKQAVIGGSARVFAGSVTVDGTISGNLQASAERITINGQVHGNVRAAADEIILGPGAKIMGTLTYAAAKEIRQGEGAVIGGVVTRQDEGLEERTEAEEGVEGVVATVVALVASVMMFVMTLALGALFLAMAPIFSVEAPDRVRASPGKSFGIGLLALVGVPVLAVLFFVTIIGIPAGVLLMAAYPLALMLGFVVGTLWLASCVPVVLKKPPPPTVARAIGYFALTLLVVALVGQLPVLGAILVFGILVLGLGAFIVELNQRRKSTRRTVRVENGRA